MRLAGPCSGNGAFTEENTWNGGEERRSHASDTVAVEAEASSRLSINVGMRMFPLETEISPLVCGFTGASVTPCWFRRCFQDNLIIWCEAVEAASKKPDPAPVDITAQRRKCSKPAAAHFWAVARCSIISVTSQKHWRRFQSSTQFKSK